MFQNTTTYSRALICNSWFVFKKNQKQGPYPYLEVVRQIQNSSLLNTDRVWASHLRNWTELSKVAEFSQESIARNRKSASASPPRTSNSGMVDCLYPICILQEGLNLSGTCQAMSLTGARISLQTSELKIGASLSLIFRATLAHREIIEIRAEVVKISTIAGNHETSVSCELRYLGTTIQNRQALQKLISCKYRRGHCTHVLTLLSK